MRMRNREMSRINDNKATLCIWTLLIVAMLCVCSCEKKPEMKASAAAKAELEKLTTTISAIDSRIEELTETLDTLRSDINENVADIELALRHIRDSHESLKERLSDISGDEITFEKEQHLPLEIKLILIVIIIVIGALLYKLQRAKVKEMRSE